MRRIKWLSFGLVLAMTSAAVPANPRVGSGHAYDILGDLPVMHRGRVKPLNSMAIEVVKLIYGRSTIELLGPDGKTTSTWEPVASLLDWSARPEFWDNQDFILVEYLPLQRLLLAASIREQVRSLVGKETPAVKRSLQTLAAQPELTEADLRTAAHQAGESSTTGKSLIALAAKVGKDHKWLSPRVLENTQLQHEGHSLTFPQWVGEILDKKDRARSDGMGAAPKLTPIEEQAIEIGERFFQYQAIREHNSPATKPLDLLVVPRPFNKIYGKYSTEVFEKGMKPDQSLSRLEANVANTLVEYLQGLQSKDWALPGKIPYSTRNSSHGWMSISFVQEDQLHQSGMHHQKHQHVHCTMPCVVELLLLNRSRNREADGIVPGSGRWGFHRHTRPRCPVWPIAAASIAPKDLLRSLLNRASRRAVFQ